MFLEYPWHTSSSQRQNFASVSKDVKDGRFNLLKLFKLASLPVSLKSNLVYCRTAFDFKEHRMKKKTK